MACALAACYRAPQLAQLPALLPPDAPSHLARQLVRAQTIRDAGGAACDVCGRRPLVAPLTEWVEWWTLNPQGAVQTKTASATSTVTVTETLPFVWRGGSWGCVPQTDKTKSAP
ncbi:hypothetical protein SPI_04578 [Niveomyces insectorum RCEF 264]|uniref:Uncharacterized protein n=1 Tax=Niveomyces insectorum RCEF 264 TaxID=1081102 RepID=A0A167UMM7_9HYPO|nr:hypothetical protein SPI_04578 [Niveomyces insectorum RCEF 264]